MSKEAVFALSDSFDRNRSELDQNGNGMINREEIDHALSNANLSQPGRLLGESLNTGYDTLSTLHIDMAWTGFGNQRRMVNINHRGVSSRDMEVLERCFDSSKPTSSDRLLPYQFAFFVVAGGAFGALGGGRTALIGAAIGGAFGGLCWALDRKPPSFYDLKRDEVIQSGALLNFKK